MSNSSSTSDDSNKSNDLLGDYLRKLTNKNKADQVAKEDAKFKEFCKAYDEIFESKIIPKLVNHAQTERGKYCATHMSDVGLDKIFRSEDRYTDYIVKHAATKKLNVLYYAMNLTVLYYVLAGNDKYIYFFVIVLLL